MVTLALAELAQLDDRPVLVAPPLSNSPGMQSAAVLLAERSVDSVELALDAG